MYNTYVYRIENNITHQFYYGSRYKNIDFQRQPENDFWIHYFTSSKSVKSLINEYGKESFDCTILHRSLDYDECYWMEQDLIKEHISNHLCLNKSYIDNRHCVKFSTAGTKATDETRKRLSVSKSNPSEETRNKMSIAKKGISTGPHSDTRKTNISRALMGMERTEEQCRNISASKTGELNPNYGKPRKEETKLKMKEWQQAHKEEKAAEGRARWQDPEYRKMMMAARQKNKKL
jgi:hypothetical protein